jgi:hypothetical protein
MNSSIKLIMRKGKLSKKGTHTIFLQYCYKEVVKLSGITDPVVIAHKRGNKIIEETKTKYAWVSSHTARRSFCTNEYLAGTPSDLIMSISGHKTEKAFKKYIKADKMKKASMIKKLWDEQSTL